jgi:hypothetical protein
MVSNEELRQYIKELKDELPKYLVDICKHNTILFKINQLETLLWYRENEGDVDGFMTKILKYSNKFVYDKDLYKMGVFNSYLLYKNRQIENSNTN